MPGTPKTGDNVFLILDDLIADLERNNKLLRRVTRCDRSNLRPQEARHFSRRSSRYAVPVTVCRQMNWLMTYARDTKSILKTIGYIVEADVSNATSLQVSSRRRKSARVEGGTHHPLNECTLSRKFVFNFKG